MRSSLVIFAMMGALATPRREVTGVVIDGQTRVPVANAALSLVMESERQRLTMTVDVADDGTFRFAPVVPGRHTLQAGTPDYPVAKIEYVFSDDEAAHHVTIELERQPKTILSVVDAQDRPVMLAEVFVFDREEAVALTKTAGDGSAPVFVPHGQEREVWVVSRNGACGVVTIAAGAARVRVAVERDGHRTGRAIPDEVLQALAGRGISAP